MGALDLFRRSPATPTLDRLDLRSTRHRISRPVSYTASGNTSRLLNDLEQQNLDGYSGSALAYRCQQAISSNAAALDLVIERRTRSGDVEPVPEHPIAMLFNRRPNPLVSARVFKEVLWSRLEMLGEVFVYLDRGETGTGELQGAYPIFDPVEVVVSREQAGTLLGYRVRTGGRVIPLLPSEVLWLRYPHPLSAWGAMAPFRAAQFALDLDGWAKAWQQGELRNGARPDGVVYLGDVDPDTHDAIVSDFRARHEGPKNANRHLFLSGQQPGAYQRIGLTAAEVSYRDTREMNAEEVFLAFGVPRDYLIGGTTYENRSAARNTLWSDTIVPKLEVVAGEIDRQLLPDLYETCRFDVSEVDALRENADAIVKRAVQATQSDLMTLDEAREEIGLEPLPDGIGEVTLTAYRRSLPSAVATALASAQPPTPPGDAPQPPLAPEQVQPDPQEGEEGQRAAQTNLDRRAAVLSQTAVEREYQRIEALGVRAVQRLAARMERVVVKQAERRARLDLQTRAVLTRQQVEDVFDYEFWLAETREALGDTVVAAAFDAGAAATASGLGVSLDLFDQQVLAAMNGRADVLAAQVVETTRAALDLALLQPGVEAGESIPTLAERLTSVFDEMAGHRATTIARTETVGGFSQAGHIAAVGSGVATGKRWMTAADDRVRETHTALDGQRVGLHDTFGNGVRWPADPMGDASETVNCRCVLTYETE